MYSSESVLFILATRPDFDKLNLSYFAMTIFIRIYGTVDLRGT